MGLSFVTLPSQLVCASCLPTCDNVRSAASQYSCRPASPNTSWLCQSLLLSCHLRVVLAAGSPSLPLVAPAGLRVVATAEQHLSSCGCARTATPLTQLYCYSTIYSIKWTIVLSNSTSCLTATGKQFCTLWDGQTLLDVPFLASKRSCFQVAMVMRPSGAVLRSAKGLFLMCRILCHSHVRSSYFHYTHVQDCKFS